MRRTVRRQIGWVVMIASLWATAAGGEPLAATGQGTWEAGGYGYEIYPDVSSHIQNSFGFGVRAGYFLRATNEIELAWDTASGDAINAPGVSFDIDKIGLMYVHNFIPKGRTKMAPLFLLGVGEVTIHNGSATDSSEYFRFGGGARFPVSKHLALRFEVSVLRWRGKGDATPAVPAYCFDANLGLSFLFGGKPGAAPSGDAKGSKETSKGETKDETKSDIP